jgi:hypothetical protein
VKRYHAQKLVSSMAESRKEDNPVRPAIDAYVNLLYYEYMSEFSGEGHKDYLAADAVLAEVTERATRDLAERAISEAVEITYYAAVNHPTYPERRPWMKLGLRSMERPIRPHDMQIEDLHPGVRIVFFNDKLTDKQKFAKHEVILSQPYETENEEGARYFLVDARRVENHATDDIPLDAKEGRRAVSLSKWGLAPIDDGYNSIGYHTAWYIEPYIPASTEATTK